MTSTSTGSSRIVVLGGTGYAGSLIVEEAARRGHDVVAVSRTAPATLPAGASHRAGDLRDAAFLADVLDGADAVVATSSPRGELAEPGVLRAAYDQLARLAEDKGVRLGVIGGAGSLHVSEGGPLLVDTPEFPKPSSRPRPASWAPCSRTCAPRPARARLVLPEPRGRLRRLRAR
jgi:putative NADH-flavin reductase